MPSIPVVPTEVGTPFRRVTLPHAMTTLVGNMGFPLARERRGGEAAADPPSFPRKWEPHFVRPVAIGATPLDPLAGAGLLLAKWMLVIVSATLMLLLFLWQWQQTPWHALLASALARTPGDAAARTALLAQLQEMGDNDRPFWLGVAQLVLLNLLLPVLTALLGYLFGSHSAGH